MGYSFTERKRIRKDFGKRPSVLETPFLLATQLESYRAFLQEGVASEALENHGLHAAFKSVFPIEGYAGHAALSMPVTVSASPSSTSRNASCAA